MLTYNWHKKSLPSLPCQAPWEGRTGRLVTSGGNWGKGAGLGAGSLVWVLDVCPCVTEDGTKPPCLYPNWRLRFLDFVTQPVIGPPKHVDALDMLSRSCIHSSNACNALSLALRVVTRQAESPLHRARRCPCRTCSQHPERCIVGAQ